MTMFVKNMDVEELISRMSDSQKDSVYRLLWAEHVKEDVLARLEEREDDIPENFVKEFVEEVVTQYVYEGKYDCNLSYWDNIDNLIENEMQYIPTEREEK